MSTQKGHKAPNSVIVISVLMCQFTLLHFKLDSNTIHRRWFRVTKANHINLTQVLLMLIVIYTCKYRNC